MPAISTAPSRLQMPLSCRLVSYSSVYFNYARARHRVPVSVTWIPAAAHAATQVSSTTRIIKVLFSPFPRNDDSTDASSAPPRQNGAQPASQPARKPASQPGSQQASWEARNPSQVGVGSSYTEDPAILMVIVMVMVMVMVMAIEMIQIDEPDAARNEGKLTGQHTAQGPKKGLNGESILFPH